MKTGHFRKVCEKHILSIIFISKLYEQSKKLMFLYVTICFLGPHLEHSPRKKSFLLKLQASAYFNYYYLRSLCFLLLFQCCLLCVISLFTLYKSVTTWAENFIVFPHPSNRLTYFLFNVYSLVWSPEQS